MAIVYGQIESLSRLKAELHRNGIDQFNSIAELDEFNRNYAIERQNLINIAHEAYQLEFKTLEHEKIRLQVKYHSAKSQFAKQYSEVIQKREIKLAHDREIYLDNVWQDFWHWMKTCFYLFTLFMYRRTSKLMVWLKTSEDHYYLRMAERKLHHIITHKDEFIEELQGEKLSRLDLTKQLVEDLSPLIAGAIGESKVSKELQKLSDDYVVINDFSLQFNPPIYNRKEDDRIYSIQIDHLVISQAGIFIIETKNWSEKSINNPYMRSPIDQVRRCAYALFVFFSDHGIKKHLSSHSWGERNFPIRSIVTLINHKPDQEFDFVKVLSLHELNRYISYFKPELSKNDVQVLADYLNEINDR